MALTWRSTAFIVVAMIISAFMGISSGKVHRVGDEAGWTILGNVNYTAWASSKKFNVGDIIIFAYNKNYHNVMQVSRADYHSCNTASPIKIHSSGNDTVTIKRRGHYYFICGIPGHCAAGQTLDIRIPKKLKISLPLKSPPATLPPESPSQTLAPAPAPDNSSAIDKSKGLGLAVALVVVAAAVQSFMSA